MNPDYRHDNIRSHSYSDSPNMGQQIYDTTSVHPISQTDFVRDRLANGISSATVTSLEAMLTKMETHIQAPLLSVTLTSAFPGFQRSMTFQNGTRSDHDLTHHSHDDGASILYGSASGVEQQKRPLRLYYQC